MRYFAYGSNLSRARIQARLGPVRDLGRAHLPGRVHRFSKRGRDGSGKGNVERAPIGADARVWGVVYELSDAQFDRLTEFELGYRVVTLELPGAPVLATAATRGPMPVSSFEALTPGPELAPTREYLDHYVTGVREHGIPDDYLDALLGEFRAILG